MQAWKATLSQSVTQGDLPFVVAMVADGNGVIFDQAIGGPSTDAMFRLYSMTKAIGSLAAMILIDRGQITLDTPVADILPQWNDLPLLTGWDGDRPVLGRPRHTATIRHLMTHMSGVEYDMWSADMRRYLKQTGVPNVGTGQLAALAGYPLMFEPGTRWGYGPSTDWLGRVVQEVTTRRIDAFCQDEIFAPLGMVDSVFELEDRKDRLAPAFSRAKDGDFAPVDIGPPSQPEFYGMGHALYSTAPDYIRFLRMVLNGGVLDGQQILSPAAARAFCADQMQGQRVAKMVSVMPWRTADVDLFPDQPVTHAAGFLRVNDDVPGKRRAGSLGWAGICNTHYWIDPVSNLAAVFMTQVLPFLDPGVARAYDSFERAVYASR